MTASLPPPHKQLHQVEGCHWKYSSATQPTVRDFERHALKNKHSAAVAIVCACAMLITLKDHGM